MGKKDMYINDLLTNVMEPNFMENKYGFPYKRIYNLGGEFKNYSNTLILSKDIQSTIDMISLDPNVAFGDSDMPIINSEDHDIYMVFSDGGSVNNGKKNKDKESYGAYGSVIVKNDEVIHTHSYIEKDWTNNIAEISGSIYGLSYLDSVIDKSKNNIVILVSDSQYVISGMTDWIHKWKLNNWKNNTGKKISNHDYWIELNKVASKYNIYFKWVRGHTLLDDVYSKYNEMCDELAGELLKKYR